MANAVKDEWGELPAGQGMDGEVARAVFGWRLDGMDTLRGYGCPDMVWPVGYPPDHKEGRKPLLVPQYSIDPKERDSLIARLRSLGWKSYCLSTPDGVACRATFSAGPGVAATAYGATPEEATCRAALKAAGLSDQKKMSLPPRDVVYPAMLERSEQMRRGDDGPAD